MQTVNPADISKVLASTTGCVGMITARHGDRGGAMFITSAQLCGYDPPLVCIAARKGHRVDLLLRDSHRFGLCFVPESERFLLRHFGVALPPEAHVDLFDGVDVLQLVTGAPILKRAAASFDCRVFRQFDLEADHELIIGQVMAVRMSTAPNGASSK